MTSEAVVTVQFTEPFLTSSRSALSEADLQVLGTYLSNCPEAGEPVEEAKFLYAMPWTAWDWQRDPDAKAKGKAGIIVYMFVPGVPRIFVLAWLPAGSRIGMKSGKGAILQRIAIILMTLERVYRAVRDRDFFVH